MSSGLPPKEFYRAAANAEKKVRKLQAALKKAMTERKALIDEAKTRPDLQVGLTAEAMALNRRRLTQIHNGETLNSYQRRAAAGARPSGS